MYAWVHDALSKKLILGPTLWGTNSKKLKEIDNDSGSTESFGNPLLSVGAPLGGGASEPDSEPSDVPRARMAKMQREATEAKSQTDTLRAIARAAGRASLSWSRLAQ